jgi:hypothetical protein
MPEEIGAPKEVNSCETCSLNLEVQAIGMFGLSLAQFKDASDPLLDRTAELLSNPTTNVVSERIREIRTQILQTAAQLGAASLRFNDDVIMQFRQIAADEEFCERTGRAVFESGCPKIEILLSLLAQFTDD